MPKYDKMYLLSGKDKQISSDNLVYCFKGRQLKYWNRLYEVGFMPIAGFWGFLCQYLLNLKKPELKCFRRLMNFNVDVLNILGSVTWNVGVYLGLQLV